MSSHEAKVKALSALVDVIMSAVRESGSIGIPEGHLYAAIGSTIPNFRVDHLNLILNGLEEAGKVSRRAFVVRAL
jgi:hypothetical protein